MLRNTHRMAAPHAYLLIEVGQAFIWALTFTLGLLYQVQTAHLDPFQLVMVGTILEASCFLGEIPTGIVADTYSRRLSVIIGIALLGVGVAITAIPSFVPIAIGNVIWGIGYTFTSGATEAWLADEVGETELQTWFTRATQYSLVANMIGIVCAGLLGSLDLRLPLIAGAGLFIVLAILLAAVMDETGFSPVPREERSTFSDMGRSLRTGLAAARVPGVVRTFLLLSLLAGITSEVFDRLWTDHVLAEFRLPSGSAAVWFAVFALISSAVSFVSSRLANTVASEALHAEHPTRAMGFLAALQIAGLVGFALTPWLWGALAFRWLRQAALTIAAPVRSRWLNSHISKEARATTLSLMSQADAIGQVVGGPSFGWLAKQASVTLALVAAAVVQFPTIPLLLNLRPGRTEEPGSGDRQGPDEPDAE